MLPADAEDVVEPPLDQAAEESPAHGPEPHVGSSGSSDDESDGEANAEPLSQRDHVEDDFLADEDADEAEARC